MNLLAVHTVDIRNAVPVPASCSCQRAACGAAESGPGIPPGCGGHAHITTQRHMAIDCPALPADTDLSRLHIVITEWTSDGPVVSEVRPYNRAAVRELRQGHALWSLALGDNGDDAARAWRAEVEEMRARSAAQQAQAIAEAAAVRAAREALRASGQRVARRSLI
ncbi:hypothetical protein ACIP9H_34125 [Streptomyces sp. NPDC088732]|uniref:hypothetical protein n=1 Tax=Streptomyces sp. NPDC088732 TaxID=3365879 RepID=UPI0037F710C6